MTGQRKFNHKSADRGLKRTCVLGFYIQSLTVSNKKQPPCCYLTGSDKISFGIWGDVPGTAVLPPCRHDLVSLTCLHSLCVFLLERITILSQYPDSIRDQSVPVAVRLGQVFQLSGPDTDKLFRTSLSSPKLWKKYLIQFGW